MRRKHHTVVSRRSADAQHHHPFSGGLNLNSGALVCRPDTAIASSRLPHSGGARCAAPAVCRKAHWQGGRQGTQRPAHGRPGPGQVDHQRRPWGPGFPVCAVAGQTRYAVHAKHPETCMPFISACTDLPHVHRARHAALCTWKLPGFASMDGAILTCRCQTDDAHGKERAF